MKSGYCPEGTPVRRADAGEDSEVGTVVVSHRPPHPSTRDCDADNYVEKYRAWLVASSQVRVYWPTTGKLEWMVSGELDHADPMHSYRPGDGEFYLFCVETGGYSDLRTVTGDGQQIAYVSDLDNPENSKPWAERDHAAEHRALLHRLVDEHCDRLASREQAETAGSAADQ